MNETTQNTPDSQVVTMLDAGVLVPFQNQPFRVATGEEMDQLKESIQEYGVLSPLLARPLPNGSYEIAVSYTHLTLPTT